ncbi:Hypothetical predicted protein [Paramuricea clavata]|uniref:Uncharacterized protein n=1 Tax=Paramuricea clavata TaxID=317549 RepID=A0A6S7JC41_PARCT|nr:Hypothetical predicted protein [Paramuricea clavata]
MGALAAIAISIAGIIATVVVAGKKTITGEANGLGAAGKEFAKFAKAALPILNKTKTDSEEYVYTNIEKVRVTVEGVPNAVYSQAIPKTRLYEEARRLFGTDEISLHLRTSYVTCSFFLTVSPELQTDNSLEYSTKIIKNI